MFEGGRLMKRTGWLRIFVPLLLLLLTGSVAAAPLQDWQMRSVPKLQGDLTGVAYGNGLYVAVTNRGGVAVSPDGVTWSLRSLPNPAWALADVTYGDGRFVAVGAEGLIFVSDNGVGWKEIFPHAEHDLNAVAYCNRQFVAVGTAGTILTSPDGLAWFRQESSTARTLLAATCSNSQLVVAGEAGNIITSPDGERWEATAWGNDRWLRFVSAAYGPSGFVIAGYSQFQGIVLRSDDGLQWKQVSVGGENDITAVTYGKGQYVAIGVGEKGASQVFTSTDAKSWSAAPQGALKEWRPAITGTSALLSDVVCAAPGCVAVGARGAVFHSPSADWPVPPAPSNSALRSLVYGSGRYVGLTQSGQIMTSSDLKQWRIYTLSAGTGKELTGLVYHNGLFLLVGTGGTVLLSRDQGATWTAQNSGTSAALRSAISAAGVVVAAGEGGTIISSYDGVTWNRYLASTRSNLSAVTHAGGTFVVTGTDGSILTSPNGQVWTEQGTLALAAPDNYLASYETGRVKRMEIRPAMLTTDERSLGSGLPYRFEAIGYDAAGKELGPVRAVWTIVYGFEVPASGLVPLATVDANGYFVGHGRGPVTLRAFFNNLFADVEVRVVPSDPAAGPRIAPPFRPPQYDYISIGINTTTIPRQRIVVGQAYKVSAAGVINGSITGQATTYWAIRYDVPVNAGPKATLDASGNLTVYEPGTIFVEGNTGDETWDMMLEVVKP